MPGRHIEDGKNKPHNEILNVTVIGGSIAGLAAAFTLANAGHRVTVLEATDGKNRRCGAAKLPPNGTICLDRWGLKTLLDKYSLKFMKYSYNHSEHDNLIGELLLNEMLQHEAFLNQNIADYTFLKDSDLWDWLYELATDSGATFKPNSKVVDIDSSESTVILQNGDRIVSDFIVGADGINGVARSVVSGRKPETSVNRIATICCTLPCEELLKDRDLATLVNETSWIIWGGDGVQLQGQAAKGAQTYIVTLSYKIPDDVKLDPAMKIFGWYDVLKLEDFTFIDYGKFSGRALKLVTQLKGVRAFTNIHVEQPILDDLVCENGRVVVVGDAAHGMAPGLQHNVALGLEDAEALGYLFSRIQSRLYVPRFLMAYDEIRGPRIAHGVQVDLSLRDSMIMPQGPMRDRFDEFLARSAAKGLPDQMNEDDLLLLWNDTLSMWLYDTNDEVEDWWTKWGASMMREFLENNPRRTTVYVDRNVSQETEQC